MPQKLLGPARRYPSLGKQGRERVPQGVNIQRSPLGVGLLDPGGGKVAVEYLDEITRYGDLPIRTVGWYLKRWGFTPLKPVRRAYERSEPAVRKWLNETYPEIKRKARQQGAEIHWGDETGLRSDDFNGRGYAPKGQTPVRRAKGTPEKTNMISTVTNQGKVRFMFYRQRLNAKTLIPFFRRLIRSADRKVFVILDNLRVHHARRFVCGVEPFRSGAFGIGYAQPDSVLRGRGSARAGRSTAGKPAGEVRCTPSCRSPYEPCPGRRR